MALRNTKEVIWTPRGVVDAVDGTNASAGSMAILANLIPSRTDRGILIPRPAAVKVFDFAVAGFSTPGFISSLLVVGDIAYGTIATSRNPGNDEPFAINLATLTAMTVSGITSSNVPTSPAATGDWTPPVIEQVGNSIIVTHPGFSGANSVGWFDISNFSATTLASGAQSVTFVGDTDTTDQPYIEGNPWTGGAPQAPLFPNNGNPVLGQIGAAVTGTGIAASTTIAAFELVQFYFTADCTSGGTTLSNIKINGIASTTGLFVGQQLALNSAGALVTIVSINRGAFSLVLSSSVSSTGTGLKFGIFARRIKLSKNTTATADSTTFTLGNNQVLTGSAVAGAQPGMLITSSGGAIPAGTQIKDIQPLTVSVTVTLTAGSASVTLSQAAAIGLGMTVAGNGIAAGATVAGYDGNLAVTLSQAALQSGSVSATFAGYSIILTQALTSSAVGQITITGGTPTNPLWGAGNTAMNNLPSRPVSVVSMNGRAWYACGTDGIVFSDSLLPRQVSNSIGVQAIKTWSGLAVTALAPLMLGAPITGGIVQAVIAFFGVKQMLQITGDITQGTLRADAMNVATGTNAPLSIDVCATGTYFVSPDGLRRIGFDGRVSEPLGVDGRGVALPFIACPTPSRIALCCDRDTVKISCPTGTGVSQDWWYRPAEDSWSGPHTLPHSVCQAWRGSVLQAPTGINGQLWLQEFYPSASSIYQENGVQLNWRFGTILLPDNGDGAMNSMVEATMACSIISGASISVSAVSEGGRVLDTVTIAGSAAEPGWAGRFTLGGQIGAAGGPAFRQQRLSWTHPIIFKQCRILASGPSDPSVRIGNLYMKHEILGYQLLPSSPPNILADSRGNILVDSRGNILTDTAA